MQQWRFETLGELSTISASCRRPISTIGSSMRMSGVSSKPTRVTVIAMLCLIERKRRRGVHRGVAAHRRGVVNTTLDYQSGPRTMRAFLVEMAMPTERRTVRTANPHLGWTAASLRHRWLIWVLGVLA